MLKTEFRGERKRILSSTLSQGEGEGSDGKVWATQAGASRTGRGKSHGQWGMDEEWTRNERGMDEEWTKNGRRMDEEWTKNERRM